MFDEDEGGDGVKRKRVAATLLAGVVMLVAAPVPAGANHDCGPPDKHDGHKFDQGDRKKPCK